MKNNFVHIRKTVQEALEKHLPGYRTQFFVLGISGGPDSVLLAHIFHALKLQFCLAHVNYHLRGKESDGDEKLVRALASQLNVRVFVHNSETKKLKVKKQSLQMLARDIRYRFFDEILKKQKADVVVLAQHANDQAETVLLNFLRGCGVEGLTGMKVLADGKFRPLLTVKKQEILAALDEKKYAYRTDSSNAGNDYKRNYLRNVIIPQLEEQWPGLEKTLRENIQRFESVAAALAQHESHFNFDENFSLELSALNATDRNTLVKQAVQAGFSLSSLEKLLQNTGSGTKTLQGKKGQLEKKSGTLHFYSENKNTSRISLHVKGKEVSLSIPDKSFLRSLQEDVQAASVKGTLTLRAWQKGDKMKPLGMQQFKLVSRILTDLKLTLAQKKQVQVLCDAEKIVWLVGFRIDDRVKLENRETQAGRLFLRVQQ